MLQHRRDDGLARPFGHGRRSPFNSTGTAGVHYAGNPGTASLAHAGSTAAVSQYDVACVHVTAQVDRHQR